ncbi:MAG: hypothetical protein AAF909_03560 [Pseudomonadota bacterium]
MRAQLLSLNPWAKGLVHMVIFTVVAALYLVALFGLGHGNLPGPIRVETDWFLFEEMTATAIALFSAASLIGAAALGFLYGAASALLYNAAARLVGGEVCDFQEAAPRGARRLKTAADDPVSSQERA